MNSFFRKLRCGSENVFVAWESCFILIRLIPTVWALVRKHRFPGFRIVTDT
jgi:hypothetical protein